MTITVTVSGNITREPELRFTPSGKPVANFGIAVNKRRKDGDRWVDDGADFYNVTAWGDLGQHASESFDKGTRVLVTGRLEQRAYETSSGEKRTSIEITATDMGPSILWATAEVTRTERTDGSGGRTAPRTSPSGSTGRAAPSSYSPSEEPF